MTLLEQRDESRTQRRLEVYRETRKALRAALQELMPNIRVIVFGSLTKPGTFHDFSDIDLALSEEPATISSLRLASELAERLGRPVDVLLEPQCRFREKIRREGEAWMT